MVLHVAGTTATTLASRSVGSSAHRATRRAPQVLQDDLLGLLVIVRLGTPYPCLYVCAIVCLLGHVDC